MNDINKIFIISDLHFGVHSNNSEWLDIQEDYFYNWLIPILKEKSTKNDILVIAGDVFDNRQNMNIIVLNKVLEIFKKISDILDIHIIVGNHDIPKKTDNEINSLKFLNLIENIYVYEEPKILQLSNNKSCLFMPWRKDDESSKQCIKENNANYLFSHTTFQNFYYNSKIKLNDNENNTMNYTDVKKFDKVFNGHIHYTQNKYNIYFVGSPYELTRNDINNKKYVHILNVAENTVEQIINDYTPKFIRVYLSDILETDIEDFNKLCKNNFVDIINDLPENISIEVDKLLEHLNTYRKINFLLGDKETKDSEINLNSGDFDVTNLDLLNITKLHINELKYEDELKQSIYLKVLDLYQTIKNQEIQIFKN